MNRYMHKSGSPGKQIHISRVNLCCRASDLNLAFTRYWQYQYQYCVLNETNRVVGGKLYIAQYGLQNTDGAMKEVFRAETSID